MPESILLTSAMQFLTGSILLLAVAVLIAVAQSQRDDDVSPVPEVKGA